MEPQSLTWLPGMIKENRMDDEESQSKVEESSPTDTYRIMLNTEEEALPL